ncbi:MAG: DRTGG domain-containing protein [Dehalococcoidia bacterium]
MSILIVASSEPRAGKSLIAAAIAYRMARDGRAVMLARLAGDDAADADAATFAQLDGIVSASKPLTVAELSGVPETTDLVLEVPAGAANDLAAQLTAEVLAVATPTSPDVDASTVGAIVTRVRAADVPAIASRDGVIAVLPEDRVLAAPSVDDIARATEARWLLEASPHGSIDRVMIGTIASDAGSPYFGARDHTAVITRYDKTDVQLAALLTDVDLLVLTGGGQPSPYLMDRVQGTRDDFSVVVAAEDTVDTMRAIEGLYGGSRFDGAGKMLRAVELLDEAGVPVSFD